MSDQVNPEIHPQDEMYITALENVKSEGLARAVYFRQGAEINTAVQGLLDWSVGAVNKRGAKVLDFACGYGRGTRYLINSVDPANVWVSDIYREAVDFQREKFGVNGFYSCHDPRDLVAPTAFDLIFVASLFTHLPRARFIDWLARLFNMLSPNGILAFSVHDETMASGQELVDGMLYLRASESRTLSKDEYGATYVTEAFMRGAISEATGEAGWPYKRLPRGLCGAHDLYVIARNKSRAIDELLLNNPPVGYVDWMTLQGGSLAMGGWAADPNPGSGKVEISVKVSGLAQVRKITDLDRPDVASVTGDERFKQSGWEVRIDNLGSTDLAEEILVEVITANGVVTTLHRSPLSAALPTQERKEEPEGSSASTGILVAAWRRLRGIAQRG